MHRRILPAVLAGCLLLLSGCGAVSQPVAAGSAAPPTRSPRPSVPPAPVTQTVAPTLAQLPRGGRAIIGHYRVVAFYGAAGTGALGVLGQTSPEQAADALAQRARAFRGFGLPVQPAMELIATVAQGSPGADGAYSTPVPQDVLDRYLDVAHRHRMLLVLDLQPGRASFLAQAKSLHHLLLDPSVSLGLDSEWKVGPGETPGGGRIGSSPASGVNAVVRYVHGVVTRNHLPDKLLVVHEFTPTMLPDRQRIVRAPGVEVTFHADGFGNQAVKRGVFGRLDFPHHPFGVGFKLFLTQDTGLMTPADVMRLNPRPDVITYQ